MKRLILIALSLALCIYGWVQIRNNAWIPADAPKWNPFAIKESGIGRTLARALTEEANTSYHHGLFEHLPPISTNPLSHWLDTGNVALGFQGRLKYRPVEQYPLRPFEVKQALEQVENNLRLAFELDPGNYTAYDVYFYFLTNEVNQTEFASMAGAQLKDDDDASASGDAPKPDDQVRMRPKSRRMEPRRRRSRLRLTSLGHRPSRFIDLPSRNSSVGTPAPSRSRMRRSANSDPTRWIRKGS